VGQLIRCSFVLMAAFWVSPPLDAHEYTPTYTATAVTAFPALQTRMPTRHGDVRRIQPEEPGAMAQPQLKIDPAQLQREAKELLELSQSLQADIESVSHGILPKDTIEKLKRIQKVAKHLRGEIAP
jgi:hypothetical protein